MTNCSIRSVDSPFSIGRLPCDPSWSPEVLQFRLAGILDHRYAESLRHYEAAIQAKENPRWSNARILRRPTATGFVCISWIFPRASLLTKKGVLTLPIRLSTSTRHHECRPFFGKNTVWNVPNPYATPPANCMSGEPMGTVPVSSMEFVAIEGSAVSFHLGLKWSSGAGVSSRG